METQEKFTSRIKELMSENEINQRQLSLQCKIPYTTINGWFVKNQRPTIDYIDKIAEFFNCTVDYLLGRENDFGILDNENIVKNKNILINNSNSQCYRIRELRTEKKITQQEVANALGITYQAYAHYETGRRQPSPDQLILLADFFNVSVDYLLGRDNTGLVERTEQRPAILREDENTLLQVYNELNIIGQARAIAYLQGLKISSEFKK